MHTYTTAVYALEFHADAPPPPTQEPSLLFKNPFVYLDGGPVYSKPVPTRGPRRGNHLRLPFPWDSTAACCGLYAAVSGPYVWYYFPFSLLYYIPTFSFWRHTARQFAIQHVVILRRGLNVYILRKKKFGRQ